MDDIDQYEILQERVAERLHRQIQGLHDRDAARPKDPTHVGASE